MTASHAVTSGRRWPSRATCGSWTRSVPPPPPITAPPRVWESSPATESAPGVTFHTVAQLSKLARVEVGSQRAGDVLKTGLPQHGVVEQPLDENHFRIGLDLRP